MTKFMIPPLPEVVLTDADETQLSLRSFQIIIIVEPDPETWMLVNNNDELVIELFNTGLAAELDPESELYLSNGKTVVHPPDIPEPNVIWVRFIYLKTSRRLSLSKAAATATTSTGSVSACR